MRILIADDGSETRLILSRLLRKWGFDIKPKSLTLDVSHIELNLPRQGDVTAPTGTMRATCVSPIQLIH